MSDTLVDYNQFVRFAGTLSETGTQTFENVNATGTLQAGTVATLVIPKVLLIPS